MHETRLWKTVALVTEKPQASQENKVNSLFRPQKGGVLFIHCTPEREAVLCIYSGRASLVTINVAPFNYDRRKQPSRSKSFLGLIPIKSRELIQIMSLALIF